MLTAWPPTTKGRGSCVRMRLNTFELNGGAAHRQSRLLETEALPRRPRFRSNRFLFGPVLEWLLRLLLVGHRKAAWQPCKAEAYPPTSANEMNADLALL